MAWTPSCSTQTTGTDRAAWYTIHLRLVCLLYRCCASKFALGSAVGSPEMSTPSKQAFRLFGRGLDSHGHKLLSLCATAAPKPPTTLLPHFLILRIPFFKPARSCIPDPAHLIRDIIFFSHLPPASACKNLDIATATISQAQGSRAFAHCSLSDLDASSPLLSIISLPYIPPCGLT